MIYYTNLQLLDTIIHCTVYQSGAFSTGWLYDGISTARYHHFCVKAPLNFNQPTNQPFSDFWYHTWVWMGLTKYFYQISLLP